MNDQQVLERTTVVDLPVAGWYDDPAGTGELRWWGGLAWTEYVKPAAPVRPTFSELTTTTPSYGVAQSYVPFATDWNRAVEASRPRKGGSTTAIWIIAFSPILTLIIQFLVTGIGPTVPLLMSAMLVQLAGFIALFLWDRAELRALELTPSSAWWVLLPNPVVYLIVRRVTLKRQGVLSHAPSNVYVLMLMVAVAVAALVAALLSR